MLHGNGLRGEQQDGCQQGKTFYLMMSEFYRHGVKHSEL